MKAYLTRLGTWIDTYRGKARMRRFQARWPATERSDVKFYRSPKVQYRYRERGQGATIVFTADPPTTLEVYDSLLEIYSQRFRVIVVELPAMGFSATQSNFTFGWRETNDELACFLREVAGPNAILAFSCVAGLIALDIAVREPKLVSRLVLLQTGSVAAFARWKAARDPKGLLAKPIVGQLAMKYLAPRTISAWYRKSVSKNEHLAFFCECAEHSLTQGALLSLASVYQVYMDPNITLAQPQQPILAIWGMADRSHPSGNSDTAKTLSDNVTFISHADLGHAPELEDPARIYADICNFCEVNDRVKVQEVAQR